MTDTPPEWLTVMRGITGLTEAPGSADNPNILKMRDFIAAAYPDMADYCAEYQHDETPWCGLTAAYCMAKSGIRPVFGKTDTDRFLWALAWGDDPDFGTILEQPRLGCVVVMERSGGGHVTLFEEDAGKNIKCRGGNQGDMVNVSSYSKSGVVAYVWPKAGGPIPPAERRELSQGDTGADVASVQRTLGLPADGDFGAITHAGVKGFQRAWSVSGGADGVVGPNTWAALDVLDERMAAGDDGISDELAAEIDRLAEASPLQSYSWPDRGRAPVGYYAGMGKAFALALTRLNTGDAAADIMAEAERPRDSDHDALAWYAEEFAAEEMDNSKAGPDTLRHLFVMAIGLGMRESSGNHWEGRDTSASNVQSDTCEAGLFQASWNLASCADELDELLDEYKADPNGFRPTFTQGLYPTTSNLDNYGSGTGCYYQWLAKYSPAFAVLMTAVGMRRLRKHWGPIGRREVDIVGAVDDFLVEVQRAMGQQPEPGPPEPEPMPQVIVSVVAKGHVTVKVAQSSLEADEAAVDVTITAPEGVDVNVEQSAAVESVQRHKRWGLIS